MPVLRNRIAITGRLAVGDRLPDGTQQFDLSGEPSTRYLIEKLLPPRNWVPLLTLTNTPVAPRSLAIRNRTRTRCSSIAPAFWTDRIQAESSPSFAIRLLWRVEKLKWGPTRETLRRELWRAGEVGRPSAASYGGQAK